MGLFKGSKKSHGHDDKHPDPSSQPGHSTATTIPKQKQEIFDPPSGPPPWHARQPASSPASSSHLETFRPPPGPPPSHTHDTTVYPGPQDPPPDYAGTAAGDPAPNNAWMVVPDTSMLPPPPSVPHEQGAKSDADLGEADRAHEWCDTHPLVKPHKPSQAQWAAVQSGDVRVMKPTEYHGDLLMPSTGTWRGSTRAGAPDACLISSAPLYFASVDAPTQAGQKKTMYYEVEIKSLGRGRKGDECSIAIGYCAVPYPTWRMPGWERGSLAIHSDDGRRYVNNTWGGKDFTNPMKVGDTVGLGITFTLANGPPGYEVNPAPPAGMDTEIFFTRNGRREGGWNLHEKELDAERDQGVDGLDGAFDLYAAVGVFGGAEFDIKFKRESWYWLPR